MNGAYYTTTDACKIANYDKLIEENKLLKEQLAKVTAEKDVYKSDNNILKEAIKSKDKQYLKIIEERNKEIKKLREELQARDNRQISLEV